MTLRIRIDHGQDAGKVWRLAKEGVYVLGRVPSVPIQVLDMKVSKEHCLIIVNGSGDGAKTVLHDSGSTHGTQVNGQPVVGKVFLKPGDEIRVGLSILRVLSDGNADVEPEPSRALGAKEVKENGSAADRAAGTVKKRRRTYPPDDLVGTEIGGYKVLEKIGQGGMGSVYVAEQLSLNREVAFKVLSEKFTSDSNFVDQFVNEARSAAALNHPNVVQVYDVGRENGRYYFSMEYVSGGSLEERLAEKGPADWQVALNWFIDAANALIFAAKREILHRDVKPDNLMLAEDGSAKLCDLGLAKKAANEDMLAAGIIGTPAFISPEAIRRKKDIDVRSDLYSLGCTFYRILTGENPYPGKTVKEILVGHLKAPVPKVLRMKPEVPAQLDEVIQKLMAKEPEGRFQTPQELLQALDKIRIQHGLEAHGLRPPSRKPLVIALIAAVLLAGGALAFIASQDPPKPVIPKEEIEKREAAERARRLAELEGEIFKLEGRLPELELKLERLDLEEGDNWALPDWPPLIKEFEDYAKACEKHEAYADSERLRIVARKARERATYVKTYVDTRRKLDKVIKKGRSEKDTELDDGLAKQRKGFDDALAKKDWVGAAAAANPETVAGIYQPYLDLTIDQILPKEVPPDQRERLKGKPLLSAKEVQAKVQEYFPGDPPGSKLVEQAVAGAKAAHRAVKGAVRAAKDESTPEGLTKAREELDAYVGGLPDVVDPKAGPLVDLIPKFRQDAGTWRQDLEDRARQVLGIEQREDRADWCNLLKELRGPGGLLPRFRVGEAAAAAEKAVEGMRRPEYQRLARQVLEDVQALEHLLGRLVSTYPDGWAKDRVYFQDARGREQSEKVKGVTTSGIDLGGENYPFEALGAEWILLHVFYVDAETLQEPRFAFEGEDWRGLALLAEMSIRYDLVPKYLQAYTTTLDPERTETQVAIRLRMGGERLRREEAAAQAWKVATENFREVREANDAMDPSKRGQDEFWDDEKGREEFVERGPERQKKLQDAWDAWNQFVDNDEFAMTVWGIVSRTTPKLDLPYAGEEVVKAKEDAAPPQPPAPPKKPDDPKKEGPR